MLIAATLVICAAALTALVFLTRKSPSDRILELLAAEEDENRIRQELDHRLPPMHRVSARDIRHLSERFSALALMGHTGALRVELAMIDDAPEVAPARAIGLLGLQLRGPDREVLDTMAALSLQEARRENGYYERVSAIVALARCMHGRWLTPHDKGSVLRTARHSGVLTRALIGRFINLAVEGREETPAGLVPSENAA